MTRNSYFTSFFVILFLAWVSFSGFIKPLFIAYGFLSCGVAVYVVRRMVPIYDGYLPAYLRPAILLFIPWLFWEMLLSTVKVVKAVWRVDVALTPSLAWVNTRQQHPLGYTFYAHSISLTPGTVCIEAKDGMMQVHALDGADIKGLQDGRMDEAVLKALGEE